MRKAVLILLALFAGVALCAICSEPSEHTLLGSWLLWEASWIGALVIDFKILDRLCDGKR